MPENGSKAHECVPSRIRVSSATEGVRELLRKEEVTESMSVFKTLSPKKEKEFRKWARDNYKPGDPVSSFWHPSVQEECRIINAEAEKGPSMKCKHCGKEIVPGDDWGTWCHDDPANYFTQCDEGNSENIATPPEEFDAAIKNLMAVYGIPFGVGKNGFKPEFGFRAVYADV